MPPGVSMLPRRANSVLSRSRNRVQPADETLRLDDLAKQADFTLLGAAVPDWLAEDSVLVNAASDKELETEVETAEALEASRLESLRLRTDVSLDPPEEPNSDEDEVLAQYRLEESRDASKMLHELRRKSLDARAIGAPFAMSTPAPARAHVKPPAPMTANLRASQPAPEESAIERLPARSMPPRSVSGPATMAQHAREPTLPEELDRDESSKSVNVSQSFLALEPAEDDMFERKKRDANRMSGISFEEGLPPSGGFSFGTKRRATVKLPGRARRTPRREDVIDDRPSTGTTAPAAAVQEPVQEPETEPIVPPEATLGASVPGLTMPKAFTFNMRPPPRDGLTAREKSAMRVAEQAAAKTQRSVSAAFAAPSTKTQARGAIAPITEANLATATSQRQSELGLGRPALHESTNARSVTAPGRIHKAGRASSLAQSMPARQQTVSKPFVFSSDLRLERPRQTEAVMPPPPTQEGLKRRRPMDDEAPRRATETKAFAFHTDKRRRAE